MISEDAVPIISRYEISFITQNERAAKALEAVFNLAGETPAAINEAAETAQNAQTAADDAQATANDAAADAAAANAAVGTLQGAEYVVLTASSALSAERVIQGSPGLTINGATPGFVQLVLNVIAGLGYTPANRAGDTFTGAVDVQGLLRCDSFQIDQAPATSVTAASHAIPINLNGTTYYLKLSATP